MKKMGSKMKQGPTGSTDEKVSVQPKVDKKTGKMVQPFKKGK